MNMKSSTPKTNRKSEEVENLHHLLEGHKVLAVASLNKVRTAQIQELRTKFRGEMTVRCTKNSLMRLALKKLEGKAGYGDLEKHLTGSNLFIFTQMSPFKLSILLSKSRVKMPAKAGDLAPIDIVIPEGNTGMAPGPVIGEFTEVGLPTKIEGGSVWINEDTKVVGRGEAISPKLASIMSRLGLKPIEVGLGLTTAYEGGLVFSSDLLQIDLATTIKTLQNAYVSAFNLALAAEDYSPQTLRFLLSMAASKATRLALAAGIIDTTTLPALIRKAHGEAGALQAKLEEKNPSLAS